MNFLKRQINFSSSLKGKVITGLILGLFLSFVIIILEPFNTNEFESNNRLFELFGFGALLSCVYLVQSRFENNWYFKSKKVWVVSYEIISTLIFFSFSGTVLYLYNHLFINKLNYSAESHWWYQSHIVVAMIPIIAPVFIYLRQKLGERIIPIPPNTYTIKGENKNELLELKDSCLLYVQAIENYVEISFLDSDQKLATKTFRQTLSNVHEQLPFLEKCHRSYLVNLEKIKDIHGNSQSAKITFQEFDQKIPLSKTLYNDIKSKLS